MNYSGPLILCPACGKENIENVVLIKGWSVSGGQSINRGSSILPHLIIIFHNKYTCHINSNRYGFVGEKKGNLTNSRIRNLIMKYWWIYKNSPLNTQLTQPQGLVQWPDNFIYWTVVFWWQNDIHARNWSPLLLSCWPVLSTSPFHVDLWPDVCLFIRHIKIGHWNCNMTLISSKSMKLCCPKG